VGIPALAKADINSIRLAGVGARGLSLRAMARSKVVTEITTWASLLPAIG
jgi:hypothetical protein